MAYQSSQFDLYLLPIVDNIYRTEMYLETSIKLFLPSVLIEFPNDLDTSGNGQYVSKYKK